MAASAGYSGTPLPKKLGIGAGSVVGLDGAPRGFEATLDELPAGARLRRSLAGSPNVALVFVRSNAEVAERFPRAIDAVSDGARLWIVWPKKSSRLAGDVTEDTVRACGLSHGWVDYKVCAVDADWSGLCFAKRKVTARA